MNDFINLSDSEADTRAELIDPKLRAAGWVRSDQVNVRREYTISPGRILDKNTRASKLSADYVLIYKNQILGIVEAKKSALSYSEGVPQAKLYAQLLHVRFTFATNGHTIYQIDTQTGEEKEIPSFPTPETLWEMTYTSPNALWNLLSAIPYETAGRFEPRYYQTNAINAVIKAMAQGKTAFCSLWPPERAKPALRSKLSGSCSKCAGTWIKWARERRVYCSWRTAISWPTRPITLLVPSRKMRCAALNPATLKKKVKCLRRKTSFLPFPNLHVRAG